MSRLGMPRIAVILAAGKGTRMASEKPKVLHEAAGKTLLGWVLELARSSDCDRVIVVVGHGADEIRERMAGADLEFAVQSEQLGTGHALLQVESLIEGEAQILVLSGDVPALRSATAQRLLTAAEDSWGAMVVATLEEPGSLGRVIRGESGELVRCVEAADACAEELTIKTVNAGFYVLPAPSIFALLGRIEPANKQAEIYLPDALNTAAAEGERVACVEVEDPREAWGVNNRSELARIEEVLRQQL